MITRERQAFETLSRDFIQHAANRMEHLRSIVERAEIDGREMWEHTLDGLRGLRNRATAHIEAAHRADDDAWPFARARADQVIVELMRALDDIDRRVQQRLAA
ncbi:hypothetical protein [Azospirillum doebereinerae]